MATQQHKRPASAKPARKTAGTAQDNAATDTAAPLSNEHPTVPMIPAEALDSQVANDTKADGGGWQRTDRPVLDRRVIVGEPTFRAVSAEWSGFDVEGRAFALEVVSPHHPRNLFDGYAARLLECNELKPHEFGLVALIDGGKRRFVVMDADGWLRDVIAREDLNPAGVSVLGVVVAEREFRIETPTPAARPTAAPYRKPRYARGEHSSDTYATAERITRGITLMLGENDDHEGTVYIYTAVAMSASAGYAFARNSAFPELAPYNADGPPDALLGDRESALQGFAAELFRAGELAERADPKDGFLARLQAVTERKPDVEVMSIKTFARGLELMADEADTRDEDVHTAELNNLLKLTEYDVAYGTHLLNLEKAQTETNPADGTAYYTALLCRRMFRAGWLARR